MINNQNIPKLRFPEFVNDGEWEEKKLIDISDFINQKISLDKLTLNNYISTENLLQDFSGVAISSKLPDVKTVTHFKENDVLISNIRPYLKKVWSATFDGGASNDVIVVRAKENTNKNFLTYLLKNEEFINYIMQGAKGVKMPRGDISLIKKYPLFISPKPNEQQKIADCLSSVDSLISAQSQKVELLKEHKKALMQQLFPQDGEEVPKLRFPEFVHDGEWEEKRLGDISDVRDGTHDSPKFYSSGKPLVTSKNLLSNGILDINNVSLISEEDYEQINKRSLVNIGDILFGMIGTIGNPVCVKFDGFAIKNVALIKEKNMLLNEYLVHFLNSEYIATKFSILNAGNTQKFIALGQIRNLLLPIPKLPEQQKIADCLSSLDEQISQQTTKLQTLKEHKKALMQQLFPNSEVNQ